MGKLLQTAFSVKNSQDRRHKVVTILGAKVKFKKKEAIKNVYVGCGDDFREGYVGCDIRKTKNAKIVCKAWELSKKAKNLENIYSRHMCEHLTFQEFEYTINDWMKALAPGGMVHIIVPNIDYHIKQFERAKFDLECLKDWRSDLAWSLAGFYGWQREDYINGDKNTKYWDVHKSCYNKKLMELYLERAGFMHINCEVIDNVHLSATARKPLEHNFSLNSGERQTANNINEIRQDHINRYNLAVDVIKNNFSDEKQLNGLDCFCGNGYGSFLISNNLKTSIDSIDGSDEAIQLAKQYYQNENINFEHKLFPFELEKSKYDYVVSLESIEHIKEHKLFIQEISKSLKENGILVISTPNQNKYSLIKNYNPFHYRHYTNNEAIELFESYGFKLIEMYGQDCYTMSSEGYMLGSIQSEEMVLK